VKLGAGTGAAGGAGSSVVGGGRGRGSVSAVGLYGHLERRDVVLDEYFVGLSIGAGGPSHRSDRLLLLRGRPVGDEPQSPAAVVLDRCERLAITFRGSVAFQFGSLALLAAQPCAEVPVLDERGERVHDHAGTEL
jgi:hypothetical protein